MQKRTSRSGSSRPFYKKNGFGRTLLRAVAVVSGFAFLAGFWFLAQLGPRPVPEHSAKVIADSSFSVKELAAQSVSLEHEFAQISAAREPSEKDLALLQQALILQQEYLRRMAGYDTAAEQREDELEQRYHTFMGARLQAESQAAEFDAERVVPEPEHADERALALLQRAITTQATINENFPRSDAYDVERVARLERLRQQRQAAPLHTKTLGYELQSEQLQADGQWVEAEQTLQLAIEIQDQLNRDFRSTPQASALRLKQLQGKLGGMQASRSAVEIDGLINQAKLKQVAGEYSEAADLYQVALGLQQELNLQYPNAAEASLVASTDLARKKETAASFKLGLEIERTDLKLMRYLSQRQIPAAIQVLVGLRRQVVQMKASFPLSSLNDDDLLSKLNYLHANQNDLPFISRQVDPALLDLPGIDGLRMLKTEVPQALYQLVIGSNPSRAQSGLNPVDSVSWHEAQTFCRQLSWILGATVRLPTAYEFRQALGSLPDSEVGADYIWSVVNSAGAAHAVAQRQPLAAGHYDLLGNVSEWLRSDGRNWDQPVLCIGGDFEQRLDSILTLETRELSRNSRSRVIGFRFVISSPQR